MKRKMRVFYPIMLTVKTMTIRN